MKFLGYLLLIAGLVVSIFFLSFYHTWAWTHVAEWYWSNYLVRYTGWPVPNQPTLKACFLGFAIAYWAWWGLLLQSIYAKVDESKDWTSGVTTLVLGLVGPWLIQFALWLQVSWFNL